MKTRQSVTTRHDLIHSCDRKKQNVPGALSSSGLLTLLPDKVALAFARVRSAGVYGFWSLSRFSRAVSSFRSSVASKPRFFVELDSFTIRPVTYCLVVWRMLYAHPRAKNVPACSQNCVHKHCNCQSLISSRRCSHHLSTPTSSSADDQLFSAL